MGSPTRVGDPFPLAKQNIEEKVSKLQQDYSRWSSMTLSHPSKVGLGEQIQGALALLKRTLYTMDKTVDKAEQDPERYHVTIRELHQRRQWIQDTRAQTQQMEKALLDVAQGFTTVAIPGNAELQGEVDSARQQEQLHLAQQDIALDKIHAAAARVADLGLGMMHELRMIQEVAGGVCYGSNTASPSRFLITCRPEQEPLIENLHQDTEGVMNRMQAASHRLQEVLKKMNFCTQLGIIIVLMIVLIFMLWYTFS